MATAAVEFFGGAYEKAKLLQPQLIHWLMRVMPSIFPSAIMEKLV